MRTILVLPGVLSVLVLTGSGCGHVASRSIVSSPRAMAAQALEVDASLENLRPALRALDGRTFKEESLDAVRSQIALTATLLPANEGAPDDDELWAASVGLRASRLYHDLVLADAVGAERGIRRVTRVHCNQGVEILNRLRMNMAQDWRWTVRERSEATKALAEAEGRLDRLQWVGPLSEEAKRGVGAAVLANAALSMAKLAQIAPAAFARLIGWMRAGGHSSAGLQLAGVGGGVSLQAVTASGALVLTEAEIIALARLGHLSVNSLALLYLARGHLHHICTDKNWVSAASGGPWSPKFKEIFDDAKLGFDDPANLVEVEGHIGPHPEAYHAEVLRRLQRATRHLKAGTPEYREAVLKALRDLADEIRRPGTYLNRLVTGAITR